jgi:hypothetical protein
LRWAEEQAGRKEEEGRGEDVWMRCGESCENEKRERAQTDHQKTDQKVLDWGLKNTPTSPAPGPPALPQSARQKKQKKKNRKEKKI